MQNKLYNMDLSIEKPISGMAHNLFERIWVAYYWGGERGGANFCNFVLFYFIFFCCSVLSIRGTLLVHNHRLSFIIVLKQDHRALEPLGFVNLVGCSVSET